MICSIGGARIMTPDLYDLDSAAERGLSLWDGG